MVRFLKKILGYKGKQAVKSWIEKVDFYLASKSACSRFTSSLYYLLLNPAFHREHQSVLKGRVKYAQSLAVVEGGCALLRRNTHRLEKGLIMRPRREIFGTAFIEETVEAYVTGVKNGNLNQAEYLWCTDVLQEYFIVVGSEPAIDRARRNFSQLAEPECAVDEQKCVPYKHQDIVRSELTLNQLEVLFKQRRSVRWYQDKPVSIDLIKQAVDVATQAPSACNRQPFSFYTVTNKDKALKVANCAMGTAGFAQNLPMMIAVVGDLSAYPAERDRHVIYVDGGLVTMQLMLALETLGLSSCPINWPDIERRESMLDKELGLQAHQRTVMLLAVGHPDPDGGIAYSQKKDSSVLVKVID